MAGEKTRGAPKRQVKKPSAASKAKAIRKQAAQAQARTAESDTKAS